MSELKKIKMTLEDVLPLIFRFLVKNDLMNSAMAL